jgi:hypothetical protein
MSDFQRQLRKHYEEQSLPADRVQAILTAGRKAAGKRGSRITWFAAAAAVVMIGVIAFGVRDRNDSSRIDGGDGIRPQEVGAAVQLFFSQPAYQLTQESSNPSDLTQWLRAQGAPASFTLPRAMAALPSFGCRVLEVRGQRVYLICFFLDVTPAELAAGGMIKSEMVVTAPDGTMMKKNRPLVHLVVAPAGTFRDPPQPGTRVRFSGTGEWNFETWSQDGVVYVAAGAIPPERLAAATPPI